MPFSIPDALNLIESAKLLVKEESTILASPEDAAYFRTRKLSPALPKLTPIVAPLTPPKVKAPLPTPVLPQPPVQKTVDPEPISPPQKAARPSSQLRISLEKIAPDLAILDTIPDDTSAKQIANRWKTKNQSAPISVLSSGELPQHKVLLEEIATALDVYFGPAKLIVADSIEKEKQWKTFLSALHLKLIVVCDSTLWQLHHLRESYKEIPTTGVRTLGEAPLFLLPDLSLYLKDPLLKRSLWKALCSKLS